MQIFIFVFTILNTLSVFAGPSRTTYQAKIVKPDGYPLEASSVNFKFTILDPAGSCILYSETYSSVNMSSTGGLISFALGSGVKTYPVSATTFEQVFSNITPNLSCDVGGPTDYTPAASDIRKIVMQFHDGSGWQTLPAMSINAVPYAMYANEATKLNGLTSSDFVQLSTVSTCTASEALRYTGTSFTCVAVGNSVTSGTVVTALGYTPADSVSLTTVTSDLSTVSSTVAGVSAYASSVSSTVFLVSSTVTSLQNSFAASFAAITSSQWTTSGTNIFYNTGNIGIGTTTPVTALDVSGGVRIGAESTTCAPALAGTLRYNASNVEYCNGTSWQAFGVSGSGITNFNGSTSGTQSFATGTGGTAPNFNTLNGVHTLNLPLASTGSVTAGLLSNADYTTFTNKITSSAASIAQVLGYVPADNAASGTYAQKANNLSDLTNIATARTNLGLGTFATASSIDLGSASATGTLAIARLPSFTGDATIAAASNTIILSNSGVTAGTYAKVTVDAKGRVTSGSQVTSSDVTTALGYTPANSATTVSSQWNTSGTTINYMTGNVGIGTSAPTALLEVGGDIKVNGLAVGRGGGNELSNVALGEKALANNASGWQNVAIGQYAMENATGSTQNTALGSYALRYDMSSTNNVAIGTYAMESNTYGGYNTAIGVFALDSNTTGESNVAVGEQSLLSVTTGRENVGIGRFVGVFNKTGIGNTLIGYDAGRGVSNSSDYQNSTVIGYGAGYALRTAGSNNILIGYKSGNQITTGANNIVIGHDIDTPTTGTSNFLNLGNLIFATGLNGSGTTISTGNVGIGITAPTAKLHLTAGTSSTAALKFTSGTLLTSPQAGVIEYDGANFYLTDSTNTRRAIAANANSGTYDNVSNINSSGNITLTPTGSVVVSSTTASTNSSTGALVVKGGLGVAGNIYTSGTIVTSSNIQGVSVTATSGMISPYIAGSVASGGSLTLDSTTHATKGNILLAPNGGNVGVGTSTPINKLDVVGVNNSGFRIKQGNQMSIAPASSTSFYNGVVLENGGSSHAFALGYTIGGYFGLNYFDGTSAYSNLWTITNSGNMGLGTTTPGYALSIYRLATGVTANIESGSNGSVAQNRYAGLNSVGSSRVWGSGLNITDGNGGYEIYDYTAGASRFLINSSGYVGIGTTTPTVALQINDNNTSTGIASAGIILRNNTAQDYLNIWNYGANVYAIEAADETTYRNLSLQPHGGNIGIGTTSPDEKLTVSAGKLAIINAARWDHSVVYHDGAVARYNVGGAENGLAFGVDGGATDYPAASYPEVMRLRPTGNVGIGTSNPGSRLHIATPVSGGVNNRLVSGNSNGDLIDVTGVSGDSFLDHIVSARYTATASTTLAKAVTFKIDGAPTVSGTDLTVTEKLAFWVEAGTSSFGGNVGIGTTNPSAKLEVAGTSVFSTTTDTGISLSLRNLANSNNWNIYNLPSTDGNSPNALLFENCNGGCTRKMTIAQSGNIGIGTASPSEKLEVNGNIKASGDLNTGAGQGFKIRRGTMTCTINLATQTGSGAVCAVSFGYTFASAPVVTATNTNPGSWRDGVIINIANKTTTGFSLYFFNAANTTATGDMIVDWVAIGQ